MKNAQKMARPRDGSRARQEGLPRCRTQTERTSRSAGGQVIQTVRVTDPRTGRTWIEQFNAEQDRRDELRDLSWHWLHSRCGDPLEE